ncbi:MAG: MFS transporter [Acidobacteriota bacterium]|jgi:predicted MFS family arabinose efflux permease|nr:MFS transporter [Acidobacteriota bacterium]
MKSDALRKRRRYLATLLLVGFCAFLTLNMTQPLLPMLREMFHVSAGAASLTVGASVLAVAIMAPLAGMLSDALGRKKVIVWSLCGAAIFTVLGAAAPNLHLLVLFRFLQGMFIPGIVTSTMAYITEESSGGSVSSAMATYVTGTVIGGFAGRFVAGLVAAHLGWHTPFVVLGALTLLGMLAVQRWLPREKAFVRQGDPAEAVRNLRMHLGNTQLLVIYAVGFHVLFSLMGVFTYISFYLAEAPFHLSTAALGSLFFVYLIGAVITPVSGKLIDAIGNRRTLSMALILSAAGVLTTLSGHLWVVVLGLAGCCSGVFVCQAASSGQIGKAAQTARSSAAGLYVSLYYMGGCAGSTLLGFFWEWRGWPACVAVIVVLEILMSAMAWFLWKDYPASATSHTK